ncbi:hypothetical protein FF36_02954 [Frankia torreyi]|uniref:Uncharacterized protein n=1 Tax=Frankia torreyi TaxID=1856 RepID=A0A0D8BFF8_9ACTN|nr:hypothetical protein FF36_02954 [Frankia torreyi]
MNANPGDPDTTQPLPVIRGPADPVPEPPAPRRTPPTGENPGARPPGADGPAGPSALTAGSERAGGSG